MRRGPLVSPWLGKLSEAFLTPDGTSPLTYMSLRIHERSAREKISTDQVAHVLNDEVSRKYIQSLKRHVSPHHDGTTCPRQQPCF